MLLGIGLVLALAFLIPYFHLALNKFDWAFRPAPTGAIFLLFLLALPINTALQRLAPRWAFTGPELLLIYAMMAISGSLASEGLHGYTLVDAVYPLYSATPENRWVELFMPSIPTWLQVTDPGSVRWFFEGKPPEGVVAWSQWVAPIVAWSLLALALYLGFFSLCCLLRKDWIEGQRLTFPFAVIPVEMAGDAVPSARSPFFRNPYLWVGFGLPTLQSLFQMAHTFAPAVPYTPCYWQIGRWFGESGPWGALLNTYAYVGFETIGILALLPAEVSLSLWLFFLLDRAQVFTFAALGFGQEIGGARVFSPSAFIAYQGAGACLMLAVIVLWQSRRAIAAAFGELIGRAAPRDPLDPIAPGAAAAGLLLSAAGLGVWAWYAGMDPGVFAALMGIYFGYSLALGRLVTAGGVYVPSVTMSPRDILVGLTGAGAYSPRTLTMVTFQQHIFMEQYKVNFLHFAMNDLKILHAGRVPGRVATPALLASVVLMVAVAPWVILHHAYRYGAHQFDTWQFRDSEAGTFAQLAASLHTPEAAMPFLLPGLLCGAAVMLLLTWLHTNFLWFSISPIGFIMGGTWAMNTRIWASAFIAWLLVVLLRGFGGLKLYAKFRPAFVGMALGHFVIMGLRSALDPLIGLHMHLSAWS